jgi:hypothetical protein
MSASAASGLDASVRIFRPPDAAAYAAELFRECFNAEFPVPRDGLIKVPTPPANWRQYVATYQWPGGAAETVGFCNWIRHGDAYLQGGMCVKKNFYRRMPREHFRECRSRGGLAQMMMETVARELDDAVAWFGYCGDAKALAVDLRAGYETTRHPYVIVKWFAELPEDERERRIDEVAAIGAF